MLYQTSHQAFFVLILFFTGFCFGFLLDLKKNIKLKNKIISNIVDFIIVVIYLFILFLLNLHFNLGIVRLYPLIVFLLSTFCQQILSKKILAKLIKKCYNHSKEKHETKK